MRSPKQIRRIYTLKLSLRVIQAERLISKTVESLDLANLKALHNGRATDLIELKNLNGIFGVGNEAMKVRFSLAPENSNGKFMFHPISKELEKHPRLSGKEQDQLVNGQVSSIKIVRPITGKVTIIEYDKQTNRFIDYSPDMVRTPLAVNNEWLSSTEKEQFKNGEIVTLPDGTRIKYQHSDKNGIQSNRPVLVVTGYDLSGVKQPGNELSHSFMTGIAPIGNEPQKGIKFSQNYLEALRALNMQLERDQKKPGSSHALTQEVELVKRKYSKIYQNLPSQTQDIQETNEIRPTRGIGR